MSKLDELMKGLSSENVNVVPLWSVTAWDKKFNSVDKSMQPKIYKYPVLLAKDLFAMQQEKGDVFLLSTGTETGWTTEEIAGDYLCNGEVVTLPWGKSSPVKGLIKYYSGKFVTGDNRIATSLNTEKLLNKYLYYWMVSHGDEIDTFYRGSGIKHPNMFRVLTMKIAVPPLEVQREIVRALDHFTLLTAELTAELTARKKQYEFYRDQLLNFAEHGGALNETRWSTIGEVCLLQAGKSIAAIDISSERTEAYPIPCYGANGLRGYVKKANEKGNKPIIGRQGALCGNICYATEHAIVVTDRGYFNSRFLYHLLIHMNLSQYKTAGAQPGLSVSHLNAVRIPVPKQDIQNKIANVLDNFDSICSDLNIGLPAEIEARQKQYEYYRDQLLNFAETGSMITTDRQTDRQN